MKHGKSEKDIRALRQEIEILRSLQARRRRAFPPNETGSRLSAQHENIIRMSDAFETRSEFAVVTEFAQAGVGFACPPARR